MNSYVALLRAVNVGGTGKLPMQVLVALCRKAGLVRPRTYIASGNALFESDRSEPEIRTALELQLREHAGKPVGVIVRSGRDLAEILSRNPFPHAPGNRVMVLFTDASLPKDPLSGATGLHDETVLLGRRELFVHYPEGMAKTRLSLPSQRCGTARNINTVAKLAELAVATV